MDRLPVGVAQRGTRAPGGQQTIELGGSDDWQHHPTASLRLVLARSAGGFHLQAGALRPAQQGRDINEPALHLGQRNLLAQAAQQARFDGQLRALIAQLKAVVAQDHYQGANQPEQNEKQQTAEQQHSARSQAQVQLGKPVVDQAEAVAHCVENAVVVDLPAKTKQRADYHPAVIARQAEANQLDQGNTQLRRRLSS